MNTQATAVDTVKDQIHALVEQLPAAQLLALHHALRTWIAPATEHGTNGAASNGSALPSETLYQEQPWRRYTTRLKESPNWDEFMAELAAARQETQPIED
jgi:hypothetical protein